MAIFVLYHGAKKMDVNRQNFSKARSTLSTDLMVNLFKFGCL